MPFTFTKTRLTDVVRIDPPVFADPRGTFIELYKSAEFQAQGLPPAFTQSGHSQSEKGVVRGLHYQLKPHAQARLIRVARGEIFDVAVDIRRKSPTYGQWVAERLSAANNRMLFIPEGFAHGYCVLSAGAEVLYFCTGEYAPDAERNIAWNDSAINIAWPIAQPLLSPKDAQAPILAAAENNH